MATAVTITDAPLSIEELLAVVAGAPVELGAAARARIEAGRAVVERALRDGEAVYGLTTGIGHNRDVRLSDDELRRQQELIIFNHAGRHRAAAPPRARAAAMAVRLNRIARGGSGASPAVAEVLAALLNAGVHPVVPETRSVGAGDLGQIAYVALVAIGRGSAEQAGSVVPGGEALARAGIAPIELEPKDGLALVSANGVSVGQAALVVARAETLARAADVVAAVSLEAARGNPSIVLPAVGAAKPYPGQIAACEGIRAAHAGSDLLAARCAAVGAGRALLPGRAAGARRAARDRRVRAPRGRDGAELAEREPARRRGRRDDALQRELPPDRARPGG